MYTLYCEVLVEKYPFYVFSVIENSRKNLLNNSKTITVENFGAASYLGNSQEKKIKDIAKFSLADIPTSQLFFHLVKRFQPKNILELGTSFGISTAYLASANPNATVFTFEGSHSILGQAKEIWEKLKIENIKGIEGDIRKQLPDFLAKFDSTLDFVYIDANHTYEGTLRIIDQLKPFLNNESVVVLDDINWSLEMRQVWEELKSDPFFSLTFENHRLGFLFLRKEQPKEHFYLRFSDVF